MVSRKVETEKEEEARERSAQKVEGRERRDVYHDRKRRKEGSLTHSFAHKK